MTEKETDAHTVTSAEGVTNGNGPSASAPEYRSLPLESLQPSATNPRRKIDEKNIESLAESLSSQAVLEPLIARKAGDKYEIVCGERRYRAANVAGLTEVPCLVRDLTDEQV